VLLATAATSNKNNNLGKSSTTLAKQVLLATAATSNKNNNLGKSSMVAVKQATTNAVEMANR
jgi:hypothetical protein